MTMEIAGAQSVVSFCLLMLGTCSGGRTSSPSANSGLWPAILNGSMGSGRRAHRRSEQNWLVSHRLTTARLLALHNLQTTIYGTALCGYTASEATFITSDEGIAGISLLRRTPWDVNSSIAVHSPAR